MNWNPFPRRRPVRSAEEFAQERKQAVDLMLQLGYISSESVERAMRCVPRENFVPTEFRNEAYQNYPIPLPGRSATISCMNTYPLFYEALDLQLAGKFLEVGTGSGYGAALAREMVGSEGLVVSVEIDPATYDFAKQNLQDTGYDDVLLEFSDGSLGWPESAPYDGIAMTAVSSAFPPPLIDQLAIGGRMVGPIRKHHSQFLTLIEKTHEGTEERTLCEVAYVQLQGKYGSGEL